MLRNLHGRKARDPFLQAYLTMYFIKNSKMSLAPKDGFPYYCELGNTSSLKQMFSAQSTFIFLESITDEKANYRYGADKWSIKQVIGHMADHERIKAYRAFLFSRQMDVQLWGYDQEVLVNNSNFDNLNIRLLIQDFKNVRNASISFIDTLTEKQLNLVGRVGEYKITLEEYLKSIVGHQIHHINIIKEKYL